MVVKPHTIRRAINVTEYQFSNNLQAFNCRQSREYLFQRGSFPGGNMPYSMGWKFQENRAGKTKPRMPIMTRRPRFVFLPLRINY
jgi:hypothetical protein